MTIDFDKLPEQLIPHFKGGEGTVQARMHIDAMGKIARLTLPAGASIGLHTHETSAEMIYVLSGSGIVLEDNADNPAPMVPGTCHYCPQGHTHSLINNGTEPLVVLAVIPELG